MRYKKNKLQEIAMAIDLVIDKISKFELKYQTQLSNVHPNYAIAISCNLFFW